MDQDRPPAPGSAAAGPAHPASPPLSWRRQRRALPVFPIVIALLAALTGILAVNRMRRHAEESAFAGHAQAARALARTTTIVVGDYLAAVQAAARSLESPRRGPAAHAVLRDLRRSQPDIDFAVVLDRDGRIVDADPGATAHRGLAGVVDAHRSSPTWAADAIAADLPGAVPGVLVRAPIRGPHGAPDRTLLAGVPADRLARALGVVPSGRSVPVVLDHTGRVVVHGRSSRSDWRAWDLSVVPAVAEALRGRPARVEHGPGPSTGPSCFGAIVPVPGLGWAVAALEPNEGGRRRLPGGETALAGGLAVTLLCAGLSVALSRWLSARSLAQIASAASALATGDLGRRVDVRGCRELRWLAESFNVMAGELEARTRQLERQAALLAASRNQFEAIVRQLPAGVILAEAPSGRIVLANRHAAEILGRPARLPDDIEHYGDAWTATRTDGRRLRPDDWPLARAIRRGETVSGEELDVEQVGGRRVRVRVSAAPIRDGEGRIVAGVITFVDVTAEREAAERLGASEAQLRFITERVPAVLWAVGPDLRITVSTGAGLANLGLRPGELVGRSMYEYLGTDDPDFPEIAVIRRALAGEPVAYRAQWAGRVFQSHFEPLVDDTGRIGGVIAVSLDVTERSRAEDALRFVAGASEVLSSSLDYQATLSEVTRLAVPVVADWCVVDLLEPDGSIRRAALAHVDPEKAAVIERLGRYTVHPSHPSARVIRTGRAELVTEAGEADLDMPDPEYRALVHVLAPTSSMFVPLVARGRTLGAMIFGASTSGRRFGDADLEIAVDLARRAALAIDNARLYEEARAAVAARDAFLARASHELRTPLTSALGTVRLLGRVLAGRLAESPETLVEIAARSLVTMSSLVNELLDASKLAAGRDPLRLESIALAQVAADAVAITEAQARERGVALQSRVPPDLVLSGDRLKVEQVLLNLLSNAIKFTPPGGRVDIDARRDGGPATDAEAIVLRVHDTGEGLQPDQLERIFEPFYQPAAGPARSRQGERRMRSVRGTGLGLSICRQIVSLHGGTIHAESEGPGRGSTFVVRLPVRPRGTSAADAGRAATV
ncbi:MAG TPA: ATP-binding protein [Thermodesulfobacteriota bacterium]